MRHVLRSVLILFFVARVAGSPLNYGTPNITSLSPTTGAAGTSVTITGTNFGATQGSSTVTFNGTAATPTSWSATSITVPGAGNITRYGSSNRHRERDCQQ